MDGHLARVELGERDAELTTAKAKALGIREKLVSYTTQMGESSSNRIHNVHLMADFIDGTRDRAGRGRSRSTTSSASAPPSAASSRAR